VSAFPSPEVMRSQLYSLYSMQQEPAAFSDYRRFYGTEFSGAATHCGLFETPGYQLVAQLWRPASPRGTLIFLHGYYDHVGLYRHLIDWALSQHLAVFSCDLPGHGLSSGERADIGDFAEYQAVLIELLEQAAQLGLPQPWHLLGQSTGGGIVLDYLLRGELREEIERIILLSPLIRPRAWCWSKLLWYLVNPFTDSIARRFTDNSSDEAFLAFLQSDPLQSLRLPCHWVGALMRWIPEIEAAPASTRSILLVQGEADRTLSWRHNLRIMEEKLPNAQRLILPEAKHHLVNENENLRQHYFAFLAQYLGHAPVSNVP